MDSLLWTMVFAFCALGGTACERRAEGELFRPLTDAPLCSGNPPGGSESEMPVLSPDGDPAGGNSSENLNLRWDVSSGCVPLTFDPELAEHEAEIVAAVQAWNDVPCSRLCIGVPVQATDTGHTTPSCKIHVRSPDNPVLALDVQLDVESLVDYRESPAAARGLIVGAWLQIVNLEPNLSAHLTHALGHALGFTHSMTPPSILADTEAEWPASGLSDGDRAAVIEKYGQREECR